MVGRKESNRRWREKNKNYIAEYREDNKEKIAKQRQQHYQDNKAEIDDCHAKYRKENKNEIAKKVKQYFDKNKKHLMALRQTQKQRALDYLGTKCEKCGSVAGLEFHHLDQITKTQPISLMYSLAWKSIIPELNKCILLCDVCHRKVHKKRKVKNPKQKATRDKNRQRSLGYLGGKCKECGTTQRLCCHFDPTSKTRPIPFDLSWDKLIVELDKCVLLCNHCHIEVHKAKDPRWIKVG